MGTHWRGSAFVAFLLVARVGAAADSVSLAPANWDQGLELPEAHDHNLDPTIVEIDLTARIADGKSEFQ